MVVAPETEVAAVAEPTAFQKNHPLVVIVFPTILTSAIVVVKTG
jgi:hypothetical protein